LKRGIGILWALIILILISFMFVFIAKVTFISSKHLGNSYAIQKAELFMQSCIENAILGIEGYNRESHNNCLTHIRFFDEKKRFECNVNILRYYCYSYCPCQDKSRVVHIKTDFSDGYVLMKVDVNSSYYHVKLSKVTLQRP